MTKIATWNVNGSRARLPRMIEWLTEAEPDIVLVQEIKATEETFPRMEIEDLGYNIAIFGQKSFNGVAIFAKSPIEDVVTGLPGDETDEQARLYRWLGWRGSGPPRGNTTAQGTSVGRPNSSPLMKLAIRPKNSPMGTAQTTISASGRKAMPRLRLNNAMARITPIAPPWNDMPPCQT